MATQAQNNGNPNQGSTLLATAQYQQNRRSSEQWIEELMRTMVEEARNVGDMFRLDYDTADVLIHDALKERVNGIPHGCLLLATSCLPGATPDPVSEPSFLLLRVLGTAKLPSDDEVRRLTLEAAKRSTEAPYNYHQNNITDQFTLNQMRFAGVQCRLIGTFTPQADPLGIWSMTFGGDIDNFYAAEGMKVYKPADAALDFIVNYTRNQQERHTRITIGKLRYSASKYSPQAPEAVDIQMTTEDIVAKRTALFGMTRTGKSNTVKTIANAVFQLRIQDDPIRVSQLIIDPDGEYANENAQDQGSIRNLCNLRPNLKDDVVIYSLADRPNDPHFRLMKVNFYGSPSLPPQGASKSDWDDALATLYMGKRQIDERLEEETGAYIQAFIQTAIEAPENVHEPGEATRYRRALFIYRAILHRAGFPLPQNLSPNVKGLFNQDLLEAMANSDHPIKSQAQAIRGQQPLTWDQASALVDGLRTYLQHNSYKAFNQQYQQKHQGRNWDDDRLRGLLQILQYSRGLTAIQGLRPWHDASQNYDYVELMMEDLRSGKLVIMDQALGDPAMNREAADRIMWRIFHRQQEAFIQPIVDADGSIRPPEPVIIYIEEAHNHLPKGKETDTSNIWVRTAKEGAKFQIGLVYSTQEPSSVQTNILANTENWFITYLNSENETRVLDRYYDFADFTSSILKTNEQGFTRLRTNSSPYTMPVQMALFEAPSANPDNNATGHSI